VRARAARQLGCAELALAEADRRSSSAVRATAQLLASHRQERDLAAQLPTALAEGALVPHYQPLTHLAGDATGDRVTGFEALVRWHHPQRGLVGAEEVVPVAERLGVLPELDGAVLRAALGDCARWRAGVAGWDDLAVWVNASACLLLQEDLVERVTRELARASLPGRALVLEITENAWLADRAGIAARLLDLQREGVRIAVDDFGTGFASLDYLVSFPVDALKVDRSLVERCGEPACTRLLSGGAWIDVRSGWLSGGDKLFDELVASTPWRAPAAAPSLTVSAPRRSSETAPRRLPRCSWVSPTASWARPFHKGRSSSGADFQAPSRTSWAWKG